MGFGQVGQREGEKGGIIKGEGRSYRTHRIADEPPKDSCSPLLA